MQKIVLEFLHLSRVLLLLSASSVLCQGSEEKAPPLTIDPFRLTIEVGNDAVFSCNLEKPEDHAKFTWFYPDNLTVVEQESNTTRIFVDTEAKLHIKDATENDTGLYLCSVTTGYSNSTIPSSTILSTGVTKEPTNVTSSNEVMSHTTASSRVTQVKESEKDDLTTFNATVFLKVYVMPSYFTEGMIILGINIGLLLLFLACLAQSLITEKRRLALYHKK